jgi:hypothetical protein
MKLAQDDLVGDLEGGAGAAADLDEDALHGRILPGCEGN